MFTPLYSQKECQTQKDEILSENQLVNMTKCPRSSARPWGRRVTGSFVACSVSDKMSSLHTLQHARPSKVRRQAGDYGVETGKGGVISEVGPKGNRGGR